MKKLCGKGEIEKETVERTARRRGEVATEQIAEITMETMLIVYVV
jgi:hypothetical protein